MIPTTSLDNLTRMLTNLYGTRNAIYLPAIRDRVDFLMLGIRNLEDAIEDKRTKDYECCLASVFARTCCVAESLTGLSVAKALASKYPEAGCACCGNMPCSHPRKKIAEVEVHGASPGQDTWTLEHFQRHAKKLYGERNKEKGLDHALRRLFSEATELIKLHLIETHDPKSTTRSMYAGYSQEIADTIAWTLAIANLLKIKLDQAVLKAYSKGCGCCKETSHCTRGPFSTQEQSTTKANTVPG